MIEHDGEKVTMMGLCTVFHQCSQVFGSKILLNMMLIEEVTTVVVAHYFNHVTQLWDPSCDRSHSN